MAEENTPTTSNNYGKRPLWQWILIYLIIGGIIYYAVYYFAFANKGGYSNNTSAQPQQNSSTKPY